MVNLSKPEAQRTKDFSKKAFQRLSVTKYCVIFYFAKHYSFVLSFAVSFLQYVVSFFDSVEFGLDSLV